VNFGQQSGRRVQIGGVVQGAPGQIGHDADAPLEERAGVIDKIRHRCHAAVFKQFKGCEFVLDLIVPIDLGAHIDAKHRVLPTGRDAIIEVVFPARQGVT
jgi:hypothetical protein